MHSENKLELCLNDVNAMYSFKQVRGSGTFIRGTGVQLLSGRFVAPYTAIYRFQANLHIGRAKDVSLKPRDAISAAVCINNDCDNNV